MRKSYLWHRMVRISTLVCLLIVMTYPGVFFVGAESAVRQEAQPYVFFPGGGNSLEDAQFIISSSTIPKPTSLEDRTNVVVLFDSLPVARQKAVLASGSSTLSSTQQDQLRQYGRSLSEAHQQFLDEIRRMGINVQLRHTFTYLINGVAISVDSDGVERLAALPGVSGIYADSLVHLDLTESVPLIGADHVWAITDKLERPIMGQGVRVAVIDTGIDYTHPDLGGCFGAGCKVVDGYDVYNNDPDPIDDNGHGTHCAGVVAASGTVTGVAPGAILLAYKVLDSNGLGTISGIIAGMERAANPDQDPATEDAVDIISLSLGYPGTPGDPWSLAVEAVAEQGVLVVVAAGNNGPDYSTLDSPGLSSKAFAVGASDKTDALTTFSSRGPVRGYPALIKPDIIAPGEDITSTWLSGGYASAGGTSMATPHVAGAAALVWQAHPDWTAEMVQANLMNTAVDLGLDVHTQGAGRIQVDNAVWATAVAVPGSLALRMVDITQPQWTVSRSFWITSVIPTSSNYILSLTGPLLESDSTAWPLTASLSDEQLTLAGGQGASIDLTLTLDPAHIPPNLERNEGTILIQSGATRMAIPFAFQLPPLFIESQVLQYTVQTSYSVAMGDLDGDGDLDAFVGNTGYYNHPANTVWLNNGQGQFIDSGQLLGNSFTWSVALGDLDGDGDLDAFAANSEEWDSLPNNVWLNNGHGIFSDSGQSLGNEVSRGVALGDLDGDGDLDAFVANGDPGYGGGEPNSIWINNGSGLFSNNGQDLGDSVSQDVALGDLDGDGDLDAFVANGHPERDRNEANKVWLNNGQGHFTENGQNVGDSISHAVALGDLDGDGDLDAFVANGGSEVSDGQPDRLWLNNGSAIFTDSGQLMGSQSSYGAALGDLFADGFLDVFVAGYHGGNKIWLNDGHANLTLSDPGFATESAADVSLGDVDGDGDVDALVANAIGMQNRLWLNRSSGPPAPPAAPSILNTIIVSPAEIELTWQDNAHDETSYHIERVPEGNTAWVEIGSVIANTTHFSDTEFFCGTSYHYRVRAYRSSDGLYSSYSNTAVGTPLACQNIIYLPLIIRSP